MLEIFCISKFQFINLNELIYLGYHKLTYSYLISSITSLLIYCSNCPRFGQGAISYSRGIFLTQGLNLCLLLGTQISTTEPSGKPYFLC